MNDMISVVMPVYNAEKYVGAAIESILNQTYPHFEFIIVDDGSEDKTVRIAESYKDDRILIIKNETNGAAQAYNTGIKKANFDIVALMDHDDISEPDRFEKQVREIINDKADVVGCNYNVIDDQGNVTFKVEVPKQNNEVYEKMLYYNCIVNSGTMIRKNIYENYGLYNQEYFPAQDFEFWIRIIDKVKFYNIQQYLHNWRSSSKFSIEYLEEQNLQSKKILFNYFDNKNYSSGKKYFLKGRLVYYFESPLKSVKYFFKALLSGNKSFENILFLVKASLLFPLIKFYRDFYSYKYYNKKISNRF